MIYVIARPHRYQRWAALRSRFTHPELLRILRWRG